MNCLSSTDANRIAPKHNKTRTPFSLLWPIKRLSTKAAKSSQPNFHPLDIAVAGADHKVPLLNGRQVRYINLDNAATTPPLQAVLDTLARFLPYYSSVHRGAGFKSQLSTECYDQAHAIIADFVGADSATNTVIFGKNTTEAINKLANRLPFDDDAVVLSTLLEHHSNDLPWRRRAEVIHVGLTADGRLDEADFDNKLAEYAGRVALVAVSGASNVTGFIQPIHRLAHKAHAAGAQILVDVAQLAAHRRIDMKPDTDPEHLDFVVLSGHKLYAPYGSGALIGPKSCFLRGGPDYCGGGTVDIVTLEEIYWTGLPDREEAGSPNVIGAVAMAVAAQALMGSGLDNIAQHEQELTAYALQRLQTVPGLTLYGDPDPAHANQRVGVIPFNLAGVDNALVAAILSYEGGIGVRHGCFCAQPYVVHLLGLSEHEQQHWRRDVLKGQHGHKPGMVRISFGLYNTHAEVDRLVEMLLNIVHRRYQGCYQLDPNTGDYTPTQYRESVTDYFSL